MRLILASKSPRRAEILKQVGLEFEVIGSAADESLPEKIQASDAVKLLSKRKATDVLEKLSDNDNAIVIAADTIVSCDGSFLGKPTCYASAFCALDVLRGCAHYVYTGVTIASKARRSFHTFYEKTLVHMRNYSDEEIFAYIETGEPFDKAGGYGIQGRGALLVEKINGDYYNVVGLPIAKVCEMLSTIKTVEL